MVRFESRTISTAVCAFVRGVGAHTPRWLLRRMSVFGSKAEITRTSPFGSDCEGFRMPAHDGGARHTGAGIRKPPREETAGREAIYCVNCYGDFGLAVCCQVALNAYL